MQRTTIAVGLLNAVSILILSGPSASAQTVAIVSTNRGWYTETGIHLDGTNYITGDHHSTGCSPCQSDFRSYFVFDLTNYPVPFASAKLALNEPATGYKSPDPSETYELHDVTTPISTLTFGGGVAAHTDLGTGIVYGSRVINSTEVGTLEINLNPAAIAALNSARGGFFAIGGSLTTLDNIQNEERIFAATQDPPIVAELRVTLVPEPATLLFAAVFAGSLYMRRPPRRAALANRHFTNTKL